LLFRISRVILYGGCGFTNSKARKGVKWNQTANIWFKKDQHGRPLWSDTYEYAMLREEFIP